MALGVFVTGGTGYVGAPLIPRLLDAGHRVCVLCRPGSESKLPLGCEVITGNALRAETFSHFIYPCRAFVHMVGTPHPAPWKGPQFRSVDLVALRVSAAAARDAGVKHFIFMSVAHPAPVMKAYIEVRMECETEIARAGLIATILRPWYVLGPGHWWPAALKPVYAAMGWLPSMRAGASRLGLVTLEQMTNAIIWAVENPPTATRILEVPDIRRLG